MDKMSTVTQKQTVSLNFDMSPMIREYINQQVVPNGNYNSAGEFVRDLLRKEMNKALDLEAKERIQAGTKELLDGKLIEISKKELLLDLE